MAIDLWVDDVRSPPMEFRGLWAETYDHAIYVISCTKIESLYLDYELGIGDKTGMDILKYIVENKVLIPHIRFNSSNEEHCAEMREYYLNN
jgi:hypothetical protein